MTRLLCRVCDVRRNESHEQTEQRVSIGHGFDIGMGHRFERRKLGLHLLRGGALQGDERPLVAHGVAVVGSGEDRDALALVAHFIAFVFDLVTAHNVVHAVGVEEVLRDVRPELAADSAL